jgi:hypothetical protein
MFGATKNDVRSEKYQAMKAYSDINDDMPDGAFFAMAEEMHGWDVEDWGWYSEVQDMENTLSNKGKKGMSQYNDEEIKTCAERDCGKEFTVTADEKAWFEQKGMTPPKRCKECRAKNRARKERENQHHGEEERGY